LRSNAPGPNGDFWRAGGNRLLYENFPISQHHTVIDAGGYHGDWTAEMLTRYGCHSALFEPVPAFAEQCRVRYQHNARVRVHQAALGGSNRTTQFSLAENGTSDYRGPADATQFKARVQAISDVLSTLDGAQCIQPGAGAVGVLKLNIEGGEYEVLESLLATGDITRMRCLLIQFHRQPPGYEPRYTEITRRLAKTHRCVFAYPFVWERWIIRD